MPRDRGARSPTVSIEFDDARDLDADFTGAGFEGGRVPLQRRIPTLRGFKNPNKEVFAVVNVEDLNMVAANSTVTSATLKADGLAKKKGRVKVLGDGELDRALKVQVHAVSASAKAKIEAAGGSVEIID